MSEGAAPMQVEDFNSYIDEMKAFMDLVLKIAFHHLHNDNHNPSARAIYDSFFTKKTTVDMLS